MVAHPAGRLFASCKRQCGALEQENSADLPVDVAGDPKAFLVAADEERRDRLADDAGIERLKLRGDGRGLIGRRVAGARAVSPTERSNAPASARARRSGLVSCMAVIATYCREATCAPGSWRGRACSASAAACRIRLLTKASSISRNAATSGFELFPDLLWLMRGIESDRGHGGLLTNLTAMMCRRRHRKARWLGVASHRRDIKILERNWRRSDPGPGLYAAAMREGQEAVSISYAVIRIFASNSSQCGLTVEIEDDSLSHQRRQISRFDLRR